VPITGISFSSVTNPETDEDTLVSKSGMMKLLFPSLLTSFWQEAKNRIAKKGKNSLVKLVLRVGNMVELFFRDYVGQVLEGMKMKAAA